MTKGLQMALMAQMHLLLHCPHQSLLFIASVPRGSKTHCSEPPA